MSASTLQNLAKNCACDSTKANEALEFKIKQLKYNFVFDANLTQSAQNKVKHLRELSQTQFGCGL